MINASPIVQDKLNFCLLEGEVIETNLYVFYHFLGIVISRNRGQNMAHEIKNTLLTAFMCICMCIWNILIYVLFFDFVGNIS